MNIDFNQGIPNTFGLEVKAQQWVEYASVAELLDFIQAGKLAKPYIHVGSGSNLLFLNDFQGTVLHSALRAISLEEDGTDEVLVRAGAGVIWDDFVDYCVEHQYYGAENLSLVPGEVGSSVVQNIGAYGVEVKDLVAWIETVNDQGEQRIYQPEECEFAYRKSLFKRPEMKSVFVTEVVFRLQKTERYKLDYGTIRQELARYQEINLKAVRQAIIDIRRSKLPDPEELGNAGSFFMNPIVPTAQFEALLAQYPDMPHYPVGDGWVKIPAGWMIERCGWKGQSLGPAGVYEKQALVLVNLGGATGADIVALSDAVRASVRQKFGIEIYPEVNFIS